MSLGSYSRTFRSLFPRPHHLRACPVADEAGKTDFEIVDDADGCTVTTQLSAADVAAEALIGGAGPPATPYESSVAECDRVTNTVALQWTVDLDTELVAQVPTCEATASRCEEKVLAQADAMLALADVTSLLHGLQSNSSDTVQVPLAVIPRLRELEKLSNSAALSQRIAELDVFVPSISKGKRARRKGKGQSNAQ